MRAVGLALLVFLGSVAKGNGEDARFVNDADLSLVAISEYSPNHSNDLANFPVVDKRFSYIVDANTGCNDCSYAREQEPPSPKSHIFLSIQILFGALIFSGGLYSFLYAFNKSGTIHPDTGAFYVGLGILGALIGVAICINALP